MHILHLVLHFVVPAVVGVTVYRARALRASLLMMATMLVDLDHLLAAPVYDPNRCSIDFHPLHATPAIWLYAAAFIIPLTLGWYRGGGRARRGLWILQVVGLGLVLHMALDWTECVRLAAGARQTAVVVQLS